MQIIWLGHSGFRIEIGAAVLLIDPWLTGNPMFPAARKDEAVQGVSHVLLTHGHGDHSADAARIAKDAGVPVVAIFELAGFLQARDGVEIIAFNKGGTVDLNGVKVTLVNACHSSTAGTDTGAALMADSMNAKSKRRDRHGKT